MPPTTPPVTPPPVTTPIPGPSPESIVSTPSNRTLYRDGPSGRYLVDGTWLFRRDPTGDGDLQGWQRSPETTGWTATTVPNAWNATDESLGSYTGAIGWYRKDFRLPETTKRLMWVMRFESVNYRARVWLNGNPIGTNAGAYLPFELRLPRGLLKRTGVNRLVIRVDSRRRRRTSRPAKYDARGRPLGGWWNYGGILREVYLRKIDDIDFTTVDVRPDLPCSTCAATVSWNVTLRNAGLRARKVTVSARFGALKLRLGKLAIGPKQFATLTRTVRIARPRLWQPDRPYLYDASLVASAKGGRSSRGTPEGPASARFGSADGRLLVNGRPLDVRGVGLQEDSRDRGFAIDNNDTRAAAGLVRSSARR